MPGVHGREGGWWLGGRLVAASSLHVLVAHLLLWEIIYRSYVSQKIFLVQAKKKSYGA